MSRRRVVVLAYGGCQTCKNALRWLRDHEIDVDLREIVEQPPTVAELGEWIPVSGVSVRKWLNTSGQSYRALGKEKMLRAQDADLVRWLAADGKLVKRPVLVTERRVLVGFDPEAYAELFGA